MRLKDQVILITGSTTGIGAAMAQRFIAEGAQVILHGCDYRRAVHCYARNLVQIEAAFVPGDLPIRIIIPRNSPRKPCSALAGLMPLVNNAALTTRAHLADTDVAFFDRMFAVNLKAPAPAYSRVLFRP